MIICSLTLPELSCRAAPSPAPHFFFTSQKKIQTRPFFFSPPTRHLHGPESRRNNLEIAFTHHRRPKITTIHTVNASPQSKMQRSPAAKNGQSQNGPSQDNLMAFVHRYNDLMTVRDSTDKLIEVRIYPLTHICCNWTVLTPFSFFLPSARMFYYTAKASSVPSNKKPSVSRANCEIASLILPTLPAVDEIFSKKLPSKRPN